MVRIIAFAFLMHMTVATLSGCAGTDREDSRAPRNGSERRDVPPRTPAIAPYGSASSAASSPRTPLPHVTLNFQVTAVTLLLGPDWTAERIRAGLRSQVRADGFQKLWEQWNGRIQVARERRVEIAEPVLDEFIAREEAHPGAPMEFGRPGPGTHTFVRGYVSGEVHSRYVVHLPMHQDPSLWEAHRAYQSTKDQARAVLIRFLTEQ